MNKLQIITLLLALFLAGCAGNSSEFTYHSDRDVPEGKGLFSGEDGVFVIYRR